MSIDVDWLMKAPSERIAEKALGSLDMQQTGAERLELMTNIIKAVRASAHAEIIERLAAFLDPDVMGKKQH